MPLFGVFNYSKEGPGIEKNAPQKKAPIVFFETFFRNIWKFITVNLFCCLISLPIVTTGLAKAGMTNVTRNTARDKHSFGVSDFMDTVKKNWKQTLALGIIGLLAKAFCAFSLYFYYKNLGNGMLATLGFGVVLFVTFAVLIMDFYVWTLAITFKLSVKQIIKNSFIFVFANLFKNLLCGLVLIAVYAVYIGILFIVPYPITLALELIIFVCTFPAFRFLLIQFCTFSAIKKNIIDPYYEQHPDEDIELRRNLGLDVGDAENTERDFEDTVNKTEEKAE